MCVSRPLNPFQGFPRGLPHPQPFSLLRRRVLEERVEVSPCGGKTKGAYDK